MSFVVLTAGELRALATRMLVALGTPEDLAGVVAESLLNANLAGHDSHGLGRLPAYADSVRRGKVRPDQRALVVSIRGATGRVCARWGWGQPAARLAVKTVTDIASARGAGAVVVQDCPHIGRLAEYAGLIAARGQLGMVLTNAVALVAPFGGTGRALGTNPVAFGIPCDGHPAIVPDFATSVVTEGKLELVQAEGRDAEPGTIITADGDPTTKTADFFDGGALLPAQGHKGYGLSLAVEVLGGVLSGMGPSPLDSFGGGNGVFMLALDIPCFVNPAQFTRQVGQLAGALRAAPAGSAGGGQVRLPGEPGIQTTAERQRNGIPIPQMIWDDIHQLAEELHVRLPQPVG